MTKGCYTCRRRRIICDNGQPTCRKCRDAGKECLGYQKPLIWVKGGVASRGKMMGRSFDDVKKPAESSTSRPPAQSQTSELGSFPVAESSPDTESPSSGTYTSSKDDTWALEPSEDMEFGTGNAEIWLNFDPPEEPNNRVIHVPRDTVQSLYNPAPWGLIDPLLKDLSQNSRFYLYHYNQNMAEDFVVYDQSKNPWRDIIALVGTSPVLAHGLSAMGALHYSLTTNADSSMMPWTSYNPAPGAIQMSAEEIESMVMPASSRKPTSQPYQHFLEFKQRTLGQLSRDLKNLAMQNDDRTLAAIVVLALLDLFESGSGAWSYHIEGAKKLLRSRPENELGKGILQGLETFAIDGCLIMEIMGSTLARPGVLSKPFYSDTLRPAMLKRLEVTSWVGCPAYLLEVIFFLHDLWYPDPDATTHPQPAALPELMHSGQGITLESLAALLQGIRNFDPVAWAQEMQTYFFISDLSHRTALAASYKAAVYLYTSRVLSRPRQGFSPPWTDLGTPADHPLMCAELITQICAIPPSDPHFKCLIWPTFIAGAECPRSQCALILEKLGALYNAVTSVNVRNAAWVLRLLWEKHDTKLSKRYENVTSGLAGEQMENGNFEYFNDSYHDELDSTFDWIDEMDESRLDWLFI
ncbi:uncharacterized protein N7477_000446 [Penicillium maclennaniae]|uniref:uncharacterized protein n=1 Tax=Penicillium maclennaniae TaxID=1343394 RepID=UPI00254238EC|nr:uncharacterized protein N7477_000446 [Penicillium maclennaniae]KAJ5684101.1 hypothetical protein N7477_000446 [Penicillium maclennaniae]